MERIPDFVQVADKLEAGKIECCLWADDAGALYVRMLRNLTKTPKPGTHSRLLFRVSDLLDARGAEHALTGMRGIDPKNWLLREP